MNIIKPKQLNINVNVNYAIFCQLKIIHCTKYYYVIKKT